MGAYNDIYFGLNETQEDTLSLPYYKESAVGISSILKFFIECDVIRDTSRLFSSKIECRSSISNILSILTQTLPIIVVATAIVNPEYFVNYSGSVVIESNSSADIDLDFVVKAAKANFISTLSMVARGFVQVLGKVYIGPFLKVSPDFRGILINNPDAFYEDSYLKVNFERSFPGYLNINELSSVQADIRNTGPVTVQLGSLFGPESDVKIVLVSGNPILYLSDEYYQPVDYEGVNQHCVCYISYNKNFSLYIRARSVMQFAKILLLRTLGILWGIASNVTIQSSGTYWDYLEKFVAESSVEIKNWHLLRNVAITFTVLSKFLLDAEKIKCLFPDVWSIESLVDTLLLNIRRYMNSVFDAELVIQDIKNSMWKEGRPAIRVTTLYQDLMRNPRGQIVILEDPTI